MSNTFTGGRVSISAPSLIASTGAASARSAIPVDSSGNRPSYVRVAARNECYVQLGDSTVVVSNAAGATAGILIQPADSLTIQVGRGQTHIAYIQGSAAGQICVSPLDNS